LDLTSEETRVYPSGFYSGLKTRATKDKRVIELGPDGQHNNSQGNQQVDKPKERNIFNKMINVGDDTNI